MGINFRQSIKAAMAQQGLSVPALVRMIEFEEDEIRRLEQNLYRFLRDEDAGLSMKSLESVMQALDLEVKARR